MALIFSEYMYMDMCFACIAVVLTNHSSWSIASYIANYYKNCCMSCMKLMCLIERYGLLNVSIVSRGGKQSNMPQGIALGCRLFPVLYILSVHSHQHHIHCSMITLNTYIVCYSYIIVGVVIMLSPRMRYPATIAALM